LSPRRHPLKSVRGRAVRDKPRRKSDSRGLDLLSTRELVLAIHREDATVPQAVGRELPAITRAVEAIVRALRGGGRLIYVGAGTSGRLATLDAAECPPTFGVSPQLVQAVVAGGRRALTRAVEGAEDSAADGARDLATRRVSRRDAVVGLTASGTTPYVLGALQLARRRGAATIGVTSRRGAAISRVAAITIAPHTGPELIHGSTRLKAGSAQKTVLNTLSTASLVRMGHVYGNWMVDVALANRKLRGRGLRILREASGAGEARAARALAEAGGKMRVALVMLKTRASVAEARRRLRQAGGDLRRALGEARVAGRSRQKVSG
jgi:N-acetylmuramic acid 6-phosphate etherase